MYRIDNATAVPSGSGVPTPAPVGPNPNGFWTNGVPGVTASTIVDADWMNAVQEEILAVIAAASIAPSKTNRAQLLAALQAMALNRGVQVFSSSGTFTVPPNVTALDVEVWGGGGGTPGTVASTQAVCGAAGGGYARKRITGLTPGSTIAVTVGAGGIAAAAGGTAGIGGTSSFGAFCSATGGTNGQPSVIGIGGLGSGGDENIQGAYGWADGASGFGGSGGFAPRGGAGGGTGTTSGNPGLFPGGGAGGGGWGASWAGAAGAGGGVTVRW
jgi:hypothetical protein